MSYLTHKPHPQTTYFGHKKAKAPNFRGFREIEILARIERFEMWDDLANRASTLSFVFRVIFRVIYLPENVTHSISIF